MNAANINTRCMAH